MAAPSEGTVQDKAGRDEKRAARRLRRASDVGRDPAPAPAQPAEAEPKPLRRKDRAHGKGGVPAAGQEAAIVQTHPLFTDEELHRRREVAARLKAEIAAESPDGEGPLSPEEEERRRQQFMLRWRQEMTASASAAQAAAPVTVEIGAAPDEDAPERAAASAPHAKRARGRDRPARPTPKALVVATPTPKAKPESKRDAKLRERAEKQASLPPLPDSWRPAAQPALAGGPAFIGGELGEPTLLVAPVFPATRPSAYRRLREWLAPRPAARGMALGAGMLVFWEICRMWSGKFPEPVDLTVDILIWAVAGVIAWRIFVWWEPHGA